MFTDAAPISELQFEDIELGDLGQKLPIGIWTPDGDRLQEYTLHRYVGHHDLDLGELEDSNEEHPDRLNRIYTQFLPKVVAEIGGYSIKDLATMFPSTSPSRFVGNMYLADVMALILNVRLAAQGSDIPLTGKCPCAEEVEILGGKNTAPHDLRTVVLRTLPDSARSPRFKVDLSDRVIYLEPLRFKHLAQIVSDEMPFDLQMLFLSSIPPLTEEAYRSLTPDDIDVLRDAVPEIHFGPDKGIDMDCPRCSFEWVIPLEYGGSYENFYCSLLSAPREDKEPGSVNLYFNRISKFLCFGDQSPCSDLQGVLNLTPRDRDWWVKELSETYEKQQREMQKSQSKRR